MTSRTLNVLVLSGWMVGAAAACGSATPPKEIVDARDAYSRASNGPAARYNPAQLHVAEQALKKAEVAFEEDGDTEDTRDLAYIAQRKAQLAEAQAGIAMASREKENAQAKAQKQTAGALRSTREQLAAERQQLAAERQARVAAEKRAKEAMDRLKESLERFASIKQETRGTVITLSGSVLFKSGEFTLLPAAQAKLDEVANALKESTNNITVEGHTDSKGKEDSNQVLSQNRAQAVVSYLVSRGVAADKIRAVGLGSSRPVADNNSAEGRANNRRVEIIVGPESEPR